MTRELLNIYLCKFQETVTEQEIKQSILQNIGCSDKDSDNIKDGLLSSKCIMLGVLMYYYNDDPPSFSKIENTYYITRCIMKIISSKKLVPESADFAGLAAFLVLNTELGFDKFTFSALIFIKMYLEKQPEHSELIDAIHFSLGSEVLNQISCKPELVYRSQIYRSQTKMNSLEEQKANKAIEIAQGIVDSFPDYERAYSDVTNKWISLMNERFPLI